MDAVEEIKSRLDVVDFVAEYLQLKPAGSGSFKACCPFHQEKTPSFFVNRPRQSWHCFGCDQGGDVISFVQKMEGMDFPEALEFLAQKVGVTLPTFNAAASSERQRLIEINELASKYFRAQLIQHPQAEHARAYVAQRGLDDLTCDLWRIGYAADAWNELTDALRSKGVTDDEMIRAGLAIKRDSTQSALHAPTIYDRFRNRLMFTICDQNGRVVGFTGRVLDDGGTFAKYVNTPETMVYKKSHLLFGLDKAKGEIKRQELAVIVEGNMDVITSHQFGVTNVVASSGTALTSDQLHLLKRFTTNFAIAFDADSAGNAATIRGLDLARALDVNVKIITMPPDAGKDPDEVIRADVEKWKHAIREALPIIEWLYRNAFRLHSARTPIGKKEIAAALLPELHRIANAVERDAWITRLARDVGVSEEALREEMRGVGRRALRIPTHIVTPAERHPTSLPEGSTSDARRATSDLEIRLQALFYLKPDFHPLAQERLAGYPLPESPSEDLLNVLAIIADREFQDQSLDALRRELDVTCALLHDKWLVEERKRLEQEMRDAELAGDTSKINELLAQFTTLTGRSH